MADFRNAHFRREEGWALDDFVSTATSGKLRKERQRRTFDQQFISRAAHKQIQQMRNGTFDDSFLPAGIRMTDEERAARKRKLQ